MCSRSGCLASLTWLWTSITGKRARSTLWTGRWSIDFGSKSRRSRVSPSLGVSGVAFLTCAETADPVTNSQDAMNPELFRLFERTIHTLRQRERRAFDAESFRRRPVGLPLGVTL